MTDIPERIMTRLDKIEQRVMNYKKHKVGKSRRIKYKQLKYLGFR